MILGPILKDLRLGRRMSQEKLAEKLKVKQSTVSSWEIDRTSPSFDQLSDLADLYGVSTDFLLGRTANFSPVVGAPSGSAFAAKLQNGGCSIDEAYEIMTDFLRAGTFKKEKLVRLFCGMNPTDFSELSDAVCTRILTVKEETKRSE